MRRPTPGKHIRLKGSGMGYLSKLPPISFRVTADLRKELEAEADARKTTLADLARTFVIAAMAKLRRARGKETEPPPVPGAAEG